MQLGFHIFFHEISLNLIGEYTIEPFSLTKIILKNVFLTGPNANYFYLRLTLPLKSKPKIANLQKWIKDITML